LKAPIKIGLFILFNLLVIEGVLRLQQSLGPIFELELANIHTDTLSDVLNHRAPPELDWTLAGEDIYGEYAGLSYTIRRDSLGLRINEHRPDPPAGEASATVLFMGDSFVEGYDDSHTLVQQVYGRLRARDAVDERARFCNAGHSSYAPSIYIAQARNLVPRLSPDLVVVIIDQLDFGDEVIRYQRLAVRDKDNRIVGVRASPVNVESVNGLLSIKREPFYLTRFLRKFWFMRVHMPAYRKGYRSWYPEGVTQFAADRDGNASNYRSEKLIFEGVMAELADTLLELMGSPERILFVSHPHVQNLAPAEDGFLWRDLVAPAIATVTAERGIPSYDVTPDLRRIFGDDPRSYYWNGDIHFNFAGFRIYAWQIADRMERQLMSLR